MNNRPWFKKTQLLQTEDYWAIWLGLAIIGVAVLAFWSGSFFVKHVAVTPEKWRGFSEITNDLRKYGGGYFLIFLNFLAVFSLSMWIMGHKLKQYIPGFVILFLGSLAIFYLASWELTIHPVDILPFSR